MVNVILGGGISGLACAFYLSKVNKGGITLYEATKRLGGWIKTRVNEHGTLFEQGPRTLRCAGVAGDNCLQLVREIGLAQSIRGVSRSCEAAKNRMIYVNNKLISLPNTWTSLFKIDPPFIKPFIFAIINDLKTPKKPVTDESIYEFVRRRFGQDYADIPLSAIICGIFAGDAKEISVKALMNSMFESEQKYGSVCSGEIFKLPKKFMKTEQVFHSTESRNWSVWTLDNGLETFPYHLSKHLQKQKDVKIKLQHACTGVQFKDDKVLLTVNGEEVVADHLLSSLSSRDLAKILPEEHSPLKEELIGIPFVNVAVVNLEYEGDLLENKGFGFLVPPNQNLPILGVIYDSCISPQPGRTVLTVMMGGKWFQQYFGENPNQNDFLKIAEDNVKHILKIKKKPRTHFVTVMKNCIPQYVVGHTERVFRIRNYIKEQKLPLTLIGNSYDGVGVNDAVFSAKLGADEVLKKTKTS